MRMRRKRNLEPRLEACSDILAARGVPMKDLKKAAEEYRALFDYEELFGNQNPVRLEIGCGNGGFVSEAARREPDVNFLAVEIISNVIVTAMERIKKENVQNVRFLNIPAEVLPCFVPRKSVECIYLNFSTPLPGSTHARQRLTSPRFLAIYRGLLKDGGTIVQKTDSEDFFDYSIEQLLLNGFAVEDVTRDLHNSDAAKDNIVTEYERQFAGQGKPIFRLIARLDHKEEI